MRVKFGCRSSELAILQSESLLWPMRQALPNTSLELLTIENPTDDAQSYVQSLEQALRDGKIDFAIHALKDLPLDSPEDLPIVAYTLREDPRDCLVLPKGARKPDLRKPIGCSSQRRQLELQTLYPKAILRPVAGSIQERLTALDAGQYGALVLNAASLKRMGLEKRIHKYFTTDEVLPAAGQGILAIQTRHSTDCTILNKLTDWDTTCCAAAERTFVKVLEGCTSSPAAAYARIEDGLLTLTGMYISPDGTAVQKGDIIGQPEQAMTLGFTLAQHLKD